MSTFSEFSVPKQRFEVFDSIYRQLYTTLAITLMLDPKLALQIMSLWIWMEKNGFIDTVEKILNLPLDLISGLAYEAALCINFLKNSSFPTPPELINSIPLLHFLMKKELIRMFLPENRVSAVDGMKIILNDICVDLEVLYNEAKMIHETVKQKLVDQEMAQITRSFNANVRLDDATVGGNLSPGDSGLSSSGRIGYRLGSSSFSLQRGSTKSEPGTFNLGLSKSWNSGPKLSSPSHYAANFGKDCSLASNKGHRSSNMVNRVPDAIVQVPDRANPDFGVIGQPRLARSLSFHDEPMGRMIREPKQSNPSHLIPNPPMRVGPSTLIRQVLPNQRFMIPDTFVPAEQRTLFVTFSKGYRVHEAELRNHMTAWFGDCIESLRMQETPNDDQPLYARIIFYSPETIEAILDGNERFKFNINGKHVWVRKYIPKNQRNKPNI